MPERIEEHTLKVSVPFYECVFCGEEAPMIEHEYRVPDRYSQSDADLHVQSQLPDGWTSLRRSGHYANDHSEAVVCAGTKCREQIPEWLK